MTDRDPLLAAVRADPYADTPRLVYADWLDDTGDPADAARAAFIRLQIQQARAEPYSPEARAAGEAAGRLHAEHHESWTRHLPGWVGCQFARGFVDQVTVAAADFAAVAAEVFAAEPVTAVQISRTRPDGEWASFEPVLDVPELARVRRFAFLPGLMESIEYDALARCRHLTDLDELSLRGNPIPAGWLTEFLVGPALPQLTALDLSDIPNIGPQVAWGLRHSPRRLARLDLSRVRLHSRELQTVLESKALSQVEELRLGRLDPREPEGPASLLNVGWLVPWARLRLLDLTGQGVGDQGAEEIARTREAGGLRWLGLGRNRLGAEAVRQFLKADQLDLLYLDVRDNGLGPPAVAALRRRYPRAVVLG